MEYEIKSSELHIVYGSQTGQSEAIAKIIYERAVNISLTPQLYILNDFENKVNSL